MLIYREMRISESSLKPFGFVSPCKVSCDSSCCVKICGEDNHCNVNIDTHEHISDSVEEQIENNNNLMQVCNKTYIYFLDINIHNGPCSRPC